MTTASTVVDVIKVAVLKEFGDVAAGPIQEVLGVPDNDARKLSEVSILPLHYASGGGSGIRTLEAFAGLPHFKCGAFNHSANPPVVSGNYGAIITR